MQQATVNFGSGERTGSSGNVLSHPLHIVHGVFQDYCGNKDPKAVTLLNVHQVFGEDAIMDCKAAAYEATKSISAAQDLYT